MKRATVVLAITSLLTVALALPAVADVERNPGIRVLTSVECANGFSTPTVLAVPGAGFVEGDFVGLSTSLVILTGPLAGTVLRDVPGEGLDDLTTWCEWFDTIEGEWFGGYVLLRPDLR